MAATTLNEQFRRLILFNELDGNIKAALRFSDPDGVKSGKSGWSFGLCQFDTQNNPSSLLCLKECGFSQAEIEGIVHQTVDVAPLAAKLIAAAETIEKWDTIQLSDCLSRALNFDTSHGVPLADNAAILAQADYFNQYGSMGNGALVYLMGLGRAVTAQDILTFKLTSTKYGKEHPKDCQRRYDNIAKLLA